MLYWFTCETSVNKMQIVQTIFYQGSGNIGVLIETFRKVKKLNSNHLTLILQRQIIMARMMGKGGQFNELIMMKNSRKGNLFRSMSWILFSPMD